MNIFELKILEFINDNLSCRALDVFFKSITALGNKGALWIVIAIILVIFKKTRKCGICLSISLIMCLVLGNLVLKPLIARVRPYDLHAAIQIIINKPQDFSFPSGHTLASFASATAIYKQYKIYGIAAFVLASLIAFSRIYLFVHYPSDVFAGIIIGILFGNLSYLIYNKFTSKGKTNEI